MEAWIGLGAKLLGKYMDYRNQRRQAEAEGAVMRQQATNAIKTMNYAFMNFEEERRDSFEQAIGMITKNIMNARTIESGVRSAVAEEQANSRTGRANIRTIQAENLRTKSTIQDNYRRKSNEIDLNKEQQLINTKTYIAGLHPPKVPNLWNFVGNVATTLVQDYTHNETLSAREYAMTGKNINRYTGKMRNEDTKKSIKDYSYLSAFPKITSKNAMYELAQPQLGVGVLSGNFTKATTGNPLVDNYINNNGIGGTNRYGK